MNAKTLKMLAATAMLAALAACSSQKEPAEQAINRVENSVAAVQADAERFASEEYAAVQKSVADLRATYDKKDYKTVVTNAPSVQKQVSDLQATVAERRTAFEEASARATEQWNGFAADMPRYIETLQKRVEATTKRRDRGSPTENSLMLDNVRNLWADASNLFNSGMPVEAARRAEEARAKAQELAQKVNAKLE